MLRDLRKAGTVVSRRLRYAWRKAFHPSRVDVDGIAVRLTDADSPRIRDALYRGQYEVPERQIVGQTLDAHDVYVELGGGIGVVAATASRIIARADRVLVLEANPALVERIRATLLDNALGGRVEQCVLGRDDGEQSFYVHREFWLSSLSPIADAVAVLRVPRRSFRSALEQVRATYLMCDIEGGEGSLFDGGVPASVRKICLEIHPQALGHEGTIHTLESLLKAGFCIDFDISQRNVLFLRRGSPAPDPGPDAFATMAAPDAAAAAR